MLSSFIGQTVCAGCGKRIELVNHHRNHHCDPAFERRRKAIDRREQEHNQHVFSEAERLSFGLYLMNLPGA